MRADIVTLCGRDDAAELPPILLERGAARAECDPTLSGRLVLPRRIDGLSLTSLQQRLVKTGGRLVRHARYYWLLLAEGHLSRRLFGSMLRRIAALPLPDG